MKSSKKQGLFFCDIYNTYFYRNENHKEELKKFINNLKEIKNKFEIEKLYFSFITSDTFEYLNEAVEDIKYHLPEDIILSKQYFINGYVENDIKYYLNYESKSSVIKTEIGKDDNIICFYADDSEYNHYGLETKDNVISIILSSNKLDNNKNYYSLNKGLIGVNECLDKIKNQHC